MVKQKNKKILEYNVIFQEEKAGGYSVWAPELPGCASQGETFDEALKNIREAIELYLEETKKETATFSYKKQFVVPVQIYA
ncbi:MAG: type II toxin-antitoxin system HicB family antitoxin [Patescibacteria group bacterium]